MSFQTEQQQARQTITELYQNSFFQRYWQVIGKFIGRGKPTSIWKSAAVVMGVNLLLGISVSVLLKETQFTTLSSILTNAIWIVWAYFATVAIINVDRRLIEFLTLRFVASVQNEQHIHEILLWANRWFGRLFPQIFFYLCYGIFIALVGFYGVYQTSNFSIGTILIYFINFFHIGVAFYAALALMDFLVRLKNWNLVLYLDDPASSPILSQISNEISNFSLSAGIVFAIILLLLSLLNTLSLIIIIAYVAFSLIPISTLFILKNQAFSRQIARAKQERLEKIQAKIMEYSNLEKIDVATLDYLKGLAEYHDRVNSSKNSLYDFESFINLIGTLALPAIPVILSLIDLWQKLFGKP